jgi:hypothetical protein
VIVDVTVIKIIKRRFMPHSFAMDGAMRAMTHVARVVVPDGRWSAPV